MPDDAADEIDEVDPELHELVALLRHLTAGTGGVCDAQPKLVHEYVDGAGPHDQQLACGDPATARAADLHPVAQLRDRVLDLTASRRALDVLVAVPRRSTQVGHGEAGIVPSRAAHASNDLGLNHNTPRLPPGGGRLATFAVDELSSAVARAARPHPSHGGLGALHQPCVYRMPPQNTTHRLYPLSTLRRSRRPGLQYCSHQRARSQRPSSDARVIAHARVREYLLR